MRELSRTGKKSAIWASSLVMVASLAACFGGSDAVPVKVVAASIVAGTDNTTVAAKTATATVLASVATAAAPVTFATGFAGTNASGAPVAVTEAAKVAFTANATDTTKPSFAIESASGKATGTTTLGSCTFTVVTSTYPAGSAFGAGQSFKVDPCTVTIPVAGKTADGIAIAVGTQWTFGNATATNNVPVAISSTGVVTVAGVALPITVVVSDKTGTTGGG